MGISLSDLPFAIFRDILKIFIFLHEYFVSIISDSGKDTVNYVSGKWNQKVCVFSLRVLENVRKFNKVRLKSIKFLETPLEKHATPLD